MSSSPPPGPPPPGDARHDPLAAFRGLSRAGTGERPIGLVHGNCQAESLRQLIDGPELATVRIPPVHELTAADLPHLRRWAERASVIVSQPVRAGYRGLPVGTAQLLAAAGPRARAVIVPVVRFAGLYPDHAIVRPPHDPGASPPLVPYHSLRLIAELAAGGGRRLPPLTRAGIREVAAGSLHELRRREHAHGAVVVSDLFTRPHFDLMRTINHPGNPVWVTLAERVRARLGHREPVADPGRPLLDTVHAPRDPLVIDTFGLEGAAHDDWRVDGRQVTVEEIRTAHRAWYAEHPDTLTAAVARHGATLAALGWR
jgi:hypothetical protein